MSKFVGWKINGAMEKIDSRVRRQGRLGWFAWKGKSDARFEGHEDVRVANFWGRACSIEGTASAKALRGSKSG